MSTPVHSSSSPGNETVLIADDTPANLQVISHCLSQVGYQILVADDGPVALELAQSMKPDIILLDIMMPALDGYETCLRLKQSPVTKNIPVLFMTARNDIGDKLKGFQMGAVDYITKPYQEEEVLARVNTHLTISRQKKALETMLEERERFMRIAAHDLRNPLTAITAWADFGSFSAEAPKVKNMFRDIRISATRMENIINDFLTLQLLKKSEADQLSETFDLKEILEQVHQQNLCAANAKAIAMTFVVPETPASAYANPAHIHQILSNYISNAIKYSPKETTITITIESAAEAWRITVRDQGPGVIPDERQNLFVEFGRISNRPTGGESSTRLGLAIVKRLAEAANGSVGVDFPPAGGSSFWVEVPSLKKTK